MYQEGYNKLFRGLIIIFIDIRFNNFNICPDLLGYIIIVSALGILENQHRSYGKAKSFAVASILFSIPDIYQANNILDGLGVFDYSIRFMILSTVSVIIRLVLIYYIAEGIVDIAKNRGLNELVEKATFRWKGILIIEAIMLISTPFYLNISTDIYAIYLLGTSVIAFIMHILFISLTESIGEVLG
ncbi:hypothetical protein R9X47_26425 [Wukongibacter baidiensis]|uniref:hypothetical protein n=1 Tax=Wukongibacter baidiensis TaxID=1723361 RepID=UPI003D7F1D8A